MKDQLIGKVALITGGTTGIGRATAVRLASEGAFVFIFGRHERELEDALADIWRISGRKAHGMIADVADAESIKEVFRLIDETVGKLDILVSNAALPARSIKDTTIEEINYIIAVNISGYLLCAKLAIERMVKKGEGHIVNIGSMSAHTLDMETDLYSATKAAVSGFSGSLRKLINSDNIKLTLIEPGGVGTDMTREVPEQQTEEEEKELLLKAEDIADCILFALTREKRCEIMTIQVKPAHQIL